MARQANLPEETLQPTQPFGTIAITHAELWGYLAESAETPVAVFRGSGKIGLSEKQRLRWGRKVTEVDEQRTAS